MRFKRIIFFLLTCCFLFTGNIFAQQYLYEVGVTGGAAFYSGDANNYSLFQQPKAVMGVMIRRNLNFRTALKLDVLQATVGNSTLNSSNVLPGNTTLDGLKFKSKFYDVNAHLEYSFFSYSDSFEFKQTRRFTPYIFAGMGYTQVSSPQSMGRLNFPFGVGVKLKIGRRLNVGAEYSVSLLMSDRLEGLSALDSPYGISTGSGFKNNDIYSYLKVYLTFDIIQKGCNCNKN